MARPKKDIADSRSINMTVRLSPNEIKQIVEKAEQAGLAESAYVREAALGHRVQVIQSTAPDFEIRNELRSIGVNLNQIARTLNTSGRHDAEALAESLSRLDLIFDRWLSS